LHYGIFLIAFAWIDDIVVLALIWPSKDIHTASRQDKLMFSNSEGYVRKFGGGALYPGVQ
jgi:hypothetical protein